MTRIGAFTASAFAAALAVSAAFAQQQAQAQRRSGTIERVDGNTVYGKAADGIADIKPGDYSEPVRFRRPTTARKRSNCESFRGLKRTAAISMRGGTARPMAR